MDDNEHMSPEQDRELLVSVALPYHGKAEHGDKMLASLHQALEHAFPDFEIVDVHHS